jgi:hypothetical protein
VPYTGKEQGAGCRPQEEVNVLILIVFVILIVLSVVALIVVPSIRASVSSKPHIIPEELDLNSVRDALIEKQGWSLKRAEAARSEYVRFLTLLQLRPGFMLVPWPNAKGQDDLDQFWHQHILDTAKYADDCNRLFGRIIHHNPHVIRGSEQETDAVKKTQRLYAYTFLSERPKRPAYAATQTGCGGFFGGDIGGHSSGNGGHGAGHGGHSDGGHGGHSCGGHSCGHGCGGHGCGGGH